MNKIVVLFLLFNLISTPIMADHNSVMFEQLANIFGIKMYNVLQKPNENVIFSPFSIQTCAAMARMGAENETALELDHGLEFDSIDLSAIADNFYKVLSIYENTAILKIANKIYVKDSYILQSDFKDLLTKKFLSAAESINFDNKQAAANNINSWVELKTNNLIKNLVSSDDINEDTRLILLNAVHFNAEWVNKFNPRHTANNDFHLNEKDVVKVPMMYVEDQFNYAKLADLKAEVLELPYRYSNLSMIIILPDSPTGLKELEQKLLNTKISYIVDKMNNENVKVFMPKFKTEFSIELTEPFKKLGMTRMFTDKAEFGKMLIKESDLQVSKIIHKAFIEVTEEGTEAAAATGTSFEVMSARQSKKTIKFSADRPFYYGIYHQRQIPVFIGNLKRFN